MTNDRKWTMINMKIITYWKLFPTFHFRTSSHTSKQRKQTASYQVVVVTSEKKRKVLKSVMLNSGARSEVKR